MPLHGTSRTPVCALRGAATLQHRRCGDRSGREVSYTYINWMARGEVL